MATVRELVTKWGFSVDDRPLSRIDARISGLKSSLTGLASLSRNITFGFAGLATGIGFLLREAGDFEQIEIAFETLTQSQVKAKKLITDLTLFALKTPFQLKGLFTASTQLLAYGVEAENMIDTLTALGNIAAGVGKSKLPQLTLAFGQVRTAGKLRGQEVRQFSEAGVPIIEAIATELGVAASAVQSMVEKGQVNFDITNKALQNLANGTGRFTGLMEKQSLTLLGMLSNLKDGFQILAIAIGGTLVPEAKVYLATAVEWVTLNRELIQQKMGNVIKSIVGGMKQLVKVAMGAFRILQAVVTTLGGLENAIKLAGIALSAFVGIQVLSFLGQIGLVVLSATKNLIQFIAVSRSAALAMWSLNVAAIAIPLAIGAAIGALFLLIEDLVVYFQGGDSLIGGLIDNFDKASPKFMQALDDFSDQALGKVKEVMDKLTAFFIGDEFAPQREKIAQALMTALDVALIGSGFLLNLGYQIGSTIVDGLIDALAEKAPGVMGLLGITSSKRAKSKFDLQKEQSDITSASDLMDRFGEADTAQVFPPEIMAKARARRDRLKGVDLNKNPDFLQGTLNAGNTLDTSLAASETVTPMDLIKSSKLTKAVLDRQQLSGQNNFNTTVNINGSSLDQEQLEQAINNGVNKAQMKTIRDITNQAQSAIAE